MTDPNPTRRGAIAGTFAGLFTSKVANAAPQPRRAATEPDPSAPEKYKPSRADLEDFVKDIIKYDYSGANLNSFLSIKRNKQTIADLSGLNISDLNSVFSVRLLEASRLVNAFAGAVFDKATLSNAFPFARDLSDCSFVGARFLEKSFYYEVKADNADFSSANGIPLISSAKKALFIGTTGLNSPVFNQLLSANLEDAVILGTDLIPLEISLLQQRHPSAITSIDELAKRVNKLTHDAGGQLFGYLTDAQALHQAGHIRKTLDRLINTPELQTKLFPSNAFAEVEKLKDLANVFDSVYPSVAGKLGLAEYHSPAL